MSLTDSDRVIFVAALRDGRDVRIRRGNDLEYAHPVELREDAIIVRFRGHGTPCLVPSHRVDEIALAGAA
jgi:hypothetical protein